MVKGVAQAVKYLPSKLEALHQKLKKKKGEYFLSPPQKKTWPVFFSNPSGLFPLEYLRQCLGQWQVKRFKKIRDEVVIPNLNNRLNLEKAFETHLDC
jgi:hypothetical protein